MKHLAALVIISLSTLLAACGGGKKSDKDLIVGAWQLESNSGTFLNLKADGSATAGGFGGAMNNVVYSGKWTYDGKALDVVVGYGGINSRIKGGVVKVTDSELILEGDRGRQGVRYVRR